VWAKLPVSYPSRDPNVRMKQQTQTYTRLYSLSAKARAIPPADQDSGAFLLGITKTLL
jgi:hypothetical protein